jgi:diguanylate cyclase (GGDEF)-like protein
MIDDLGLGPDALRRFNDQLQTFIRCYMQGQTPQRAAGAVPDYPLDDAGLDFKPCWQANTCNHDDCPAHGLGPTRCWLRVGTLSGLDTVGCYASELESCYDCLILKSVLADPLLALRENAMILAHQLSTRTRSLRELAIRDEMTGLHNRRLLHEILPAAAARATRQGAEVWLMMLDLDGLKEINDTCGHPTGDQALIALASVLRAAVRTSDFVFRLGGDEFLVLLADASEAIAGTVEGRIREAIATWNTSPARDFALSASCGSAAYAADEGLDVCLRRADERMYKDKSGTYDLPDEG